MMKYLLILIALLFLSLPTMADGTVTAIKPLFINVDHGVNVTLNAPATSVFVANSDIADVQVMSPTSVMVFGKRTGETSFVATDAAGHALMQRTISVTQDMTGLRRTLDLAIPGNKISVSSLPNGLVLTGEAKDAATVADAYKMAQRFIPSGGDIINRIRVNGSNQIQIRVRFAEVQRNIDNTLGFSWQNALDVGGFTFGLATGNIVSATGSGIFNSGTANNTGLFPRPNNTSLGLPNGVLGLSRTGGRLNVNSLIDALAQDGLVTILAEPNLTALSGETANFLAGGEFPIPVPQGNGTISIDFKNYGVSLAFTPTLIGENRISLHVKPEVSQLTSVGSIVLSNITVPAITTRRAETTVEVASGQSFAVAGLIDNNQAQTVDKYPVLGDMPVLGALFRSNRFQSGQTELVIIITPYIVKPSGDQQLALPTDGFSPPTQADQILGMRNSASNPDMRPLSGPPAAVRGDIPALPATPLSDVPAAAPVAPVSSSETPQTSVLSPAPMVVAEPEMPVAVPTLKAVPAEREVTNLSVGSVPDAARITGKNTPFVPETPVVPPVVTTQVSLNPVRLKSTNLNPDGTPPAGSGGFILE